MTSKLKSVITHSDILGQELKVNDFVAYPSSSGLGRNQLKVGKIVDLTPKMVKVVHMLRRSVYEAKITTRYPKDCILLDDTLITLYILKHHGSS
jgi:hypothetical protein